MTEADLAFEAQRRRRDRELIDRIFGLDETALVSECHAAGLRVVSTHREDLRAQLFSFSRTAASRRGPAAPIA